MDSTLLSVWEKILHSFKVYPLTSSKLYFKIHVPVCMVVGAYNPVFIRLGQIDLNFKAVLHSKSLSQIHTTKIIRYQLNTFNFRNFCWTYRKTNVPNIICFPFRRLIGKLQPFMTSVKKICLKGMGTMTTWTGRFQYRCVTKAGLFQTSIMQPKCVQWTPSRWDSTGDCAS